MKTINLAEYFTEDELILAVKLKTAKPICEQIVKPVINRLNKDIGQENDPLYISYALEYAISTISITDIEKSTIAKL